MQEPGPEKSMPFLTQIIISGIKALGMMKRSQDIYVVNMYLKRKAELRRLFVLHPITKKEWDCTRLIYNKTQLCMLGNMYL